MWRTKISSPLRSNICAGVIGLGVGEQHALEYLNEKNVELIAVADIDLTKAKNFAEKHKIPHYSTNWKTIIDNPKIDVVSICSYDNMHAEQTIEALNANKHVMVEKPAVLNQIEAKKVLDAIEKSGKFITSNLILRRSPRFIALKKAVSDGVYGNIFNIEGDYQHNIEWKITDDWRGKMPFYSVVYGGGVHLIDLMRWIIKDEVDEVMAYGTNISTKNSSYHSEDTITAIMKYRNGAIGKTMTTFSPQRSKFHSLNVFGTKKTFINDIPYAKIFDGIESTNEKIDNTLYPGMKKGDLIPNFIKSISNGIKPEINETDIFRVMSICFAINNSIITKKPSQVKYLV